MGTETVRVEDMSESERRYVMSLSAAERKDALVRAGLDKERQSRVDVMMQQYEKIRSGEVIPLTIDPNGVPYADVGRVTPTGKNRSLTDLGRVPLDPTIHAVRDESGFMLFVSGYADEDDEGVQAGLRIHKTFSAITKLALGEDYDGDDEDEE